MKKYSVVLFDLDGTLSDPKIGITKSVQYALQKADIEVSDLDELESFIGPPLQVSFHEIYGFNDAQIEQAISNYRERFKERGMFENKLYENIPALLADLKQLGYILAIATSKPTLFAEQILKYFNLEHFFDLVAGSNLDGTRSAKGEIIAFVHEHFNSFQQLFGHLLKEVKASGGCHGIGFVQAQSRFRTQLCRGIID
ncbi:HAD hydrolase-like protein [Lysinibacillus agricola]|uniref:HAD hydrolase-like protein n=1 Tax=Lysinibacillus agricola TaxID=2590012 RepID=UPI003C204148